jgi:hypothetical protein
MLRPMSTVAEIEAAVEALSKAEQKLLLARLSLHLGNSVGAPPNQVRRLPLVPASGCSITQKEIDDALDTD